MPANYLASFGGYQSARCDCKLTAEFAAALSACIIDSKMKPNMKNDGPPSTPFEKPAAMDRFFNRLFGLLIRIGIGLSHNYLLEVRGRKSGRKYSTPVNLLELDGSEYLVAPRGFTQWVKNVIASGEATLVRGLKRREIILKSVSNDAKPKILKVYLDGYSKTVQRFFPIKAGSPVEAFQPLASRYPVFEVSTKT
jgi:deazaflavin-dependent oxidoreductase (nitroreductase family)